jgi:hypothetical protein
VTSSATERAADYHADLGERPTLSSSIANLLVARTPAHARAAHPKLAAQPVRRESEAMDMGTAVHQLLLRDDRVDVLEFPDYRTKAAKEARDASRVAGRVPLLAAKWEEAQAIAEQVREQILTLRTEPTPFTEGQAEHVIRYHDNGADCRAMLDWLRDDREFIDDLKTTGLSADPPRWSRHLFNLGYDIRAAFYTRAVEIEYGVTPRFRWVVVETSPPYPVTAVELSGRAMESARIRVDRAIELWNQCLESDVWPAYSRDVYVADLPPWMDDRSYGWSEVDVDETVPF